MEVTKTKKKVKFLKSPTGAYKLGYNAGDKASLTSEQADELVENKFAEFVK